MNDNNDLVKWWFVDMETMGYTQNSVILSIGILCIPDIEKDYTKNIEELKKYGICLNLNKAEQIKQKRYIAESAVRFWETEGKGSVCLVPDKKCVSLNTAIRTITDFVNKMDLGKDDLVWSKGLFDKFLYEDLCRNLNVSNCFQYSNWVDTKTALGILTGDMMIKTKYDDFAKKIHNALLNCIVEYTQIKTAIG